MVDTPLSKLSAAAALDGSEPVWISQVSASVTISAATISAQASDNSFNDSGTGFITAGFAVGDYVHVTGFTGNVANNIFSGKITALTAGKMTIGGTDGDVIVDDAAGESVTIKKWVSVRGTAQDIADLGGGGAASFERARVIPTTSGFTLQNAGTATITDATYGMEVKSPNVASQIRFVRKNGSPPATPYSIISRAAPVHPRQNNGYYNCIILRNSTSGRIIISGQFSNTQYFIQKWSAYPTYNSDLLAPQNWGHLPSTPWQKLENDGTNLRWYLSCDGDRWLETGSTTLAAYINGAGGSVDEIGFGLMVNGTDVIYMQQSFEVV